MYLGNECWKQQTWFTFFTVLLKLNISNHSKTYLHKRDPCILSRWIQDSPFSVWTHQGANSTMVGLAKVQTNVFWTHQNKLLQVFLSDKYIIYYSSSMSEVIGLLLTYPNIIHVVRLIFYFYVVFIHLYIVYKMRKRPFVIVQCLKIKQILPIVLVC